MAPCIKLWNTKMAALKFFHHTDFEEMSLVANKRTTQETETTQEKALWET